MMSLVPRLKHLTHVVIINVLYDLTWGSLLNDFSIEFDIGHRPITLKNIRIHCHFLIIGVIIECLSVPGKTPDTRELLSILLMMGNKHYKFCLISHEGIVSKEQDLVGKLPIILATSELESCSKHGIAVSHSLVSCSYPVSAVIFDLIVSTFSTKNAKKSLARPTSEFATGKVFIDVF